MDRFTIAASDRDVTMATRDRDGDLLAYVGLTRGERLRTFTEQRLRTGTSRGAPNHTGSGQEPGTLITVFGSTPDILVDTGTVEEDGPFRFTLDLPSSLEAGDTRLVVLRRTRRYRVACAGHAGTVACAPSSARPSASTTHARRQ